jgi:hypothetical protein
VTAASLGTRGRAVTAAFVNSSFIRERVDVWRRRVRQGHLGMGGELWDLGPQRPAVHARLLAYAQALGRSWDAEGIDFLLVQFLLPELLNAVEGVERSLYAMHDAAARAQAQCDTCTSRLPHDETEPEYGSHLAVPAVSDVWYEFVNMIVWGLGAPSRTVSNAAVSAETPNRGCYLCWRLVACATKSKPHWRSCDKDTCPKCASSRTIPSTVASSRPPAHPTLASIMERTGSAT